MSSYAEIDGQELIEENERLKASSEYQVAPQTEKIIHRIVRTEYFRDTIYHFSKRAYSIASKAAVIFLAIFVLFSTTMVASANFRSIIYRLIFTHEPRYTLIMIDSAADLEFVGNEVYTWDNAFAPTMMPPGYVVSDVITLTDVMLVTYTNDDGGYIDFWQNSSDADTAIQVDTELAQIVRNVLINDSEGLAVSKDGVNTVAWRVGNVILLLESNESLDMLITIAEGVILLR